MFLNAFEFASGTSYEVVVSGKEGAEDTSEMLRTINASFIPNKVVIFRPDMKSPEITPVNPRSSRRTFCAK